MIGEAIPSGIKRSTRLSSVLILAIERSVETSPHGLDVIYSFRCSYQLALHPSHVIISDLLHTGVLAVLSRQEVDEDSRMLRHSRNPAANTVIPTNIPTANAKIAIKDVPYFFHVS